MSAQARMAALVRFQLREQPSFAGLRLELCLRLVVLGAQPLQVGMVKWIPAMVGIGSAAVASSLCDGVDRFALPACGDSALMSQLCPVGR